MVTLSGQPRRPARATRVQFPVILIVGLCLIGGGMPAMAEDIVDVREELQTIKKEISSIRDDVQAIRKILDEARGRARAPQVNVRVSIDGAPMLGKQNAPITLIEFSDYECPFCHRFFTQTLPIIKTEYVDTGKVRYIFRDYPLDAIHPNARKAAEAAHCAGEQGKYWEMHDVIFEARKPLSPTDFPGFATMLSLDSARFEACLDSGKYAAGIDKDIQDGTLAGVTGTPGFFIGRTERGVTIDGRLVTGAQPLTVFTQLFEALLKGKDIDGETE